MKKPILITPLWHQKFTKLRRKSGDFRLIALFKNIIDAPRDPVLHEAANKIGGR